MVEKREVEYLLLSSDSASNVLTDISEDLLSVNRVELFQESQNTYDESSSVSSHLLIC
jgi:hypothetical protein